MPMVLRVHAHGCTWGTGPCTCTPREFTDGKQAVQAHGGDSRRLQVVAVIPPPPKLPEPIPLHKSQSWRHKQAISY